jgi:hypothetical protein
MLIKLVKALPSRLYIPDSSEIVQSGKLLQELIASLIASVQVPNVEQEEGTGITVADDICDKISNTLK